MSLGSLLSIARSALIAQQRAMEVTGHNVANANTPGYSRQTLQMQAATPLELPLYSLGRGVEANQITRSRDTFYDEAYRSDNGMLGRSNTMSSYLSQIEGTLNEPSSSGLSAALDHLFSSLSDLSGDPASHSNREMVVSATNRVTSQLHGMANALAKMKQDAVQDLQLQVNNVNSLASQIAEVNGEITQSSGPGGPSADLLDKRDGLIDQLSQYMAVQVTKNADGSVGVAAGDVMLVSGSQTVSLAVVPVGSGSGIAAAGGGPALDPQQGSIKALTDLTQNKIPTVLAGLDQIASALVTEFNNVHRGGFTLSGATGVDFFDPTRTTASTIDLSVLVKASSDNIAASGNGVPGNGTVASTLAGFATNGAASLGGNTFRSTFVSLASGVGLDVQNAQADVDARQTLVDRDDQVRTSVSGVNVDEEMVSLISQQQAYQAAAHLVSVANDMSQALLDLLN
jgi:flagellar hook-associated protein 1 FlgK